MVRVADIEAAAVLTVVHPEEATDAIATTIMPITLAHATGPGFPRHHHLLDGSPLRPAHRASALVCRRRLHRRTCTATVVATMVVVTLRAMVMAEATALRRLPNLTVDSTTAAEDEEDTKTRDIVSLHLRDVMIITTVEVTMVVVAGATIAEVTETNGAMTAAIAVKG